KYNDLHKIQGLEIIPQEIFNFIKFNFALTSPQQKMDKSHLFFKIVGGEFVFAGEKPQTIVGLLDKVSQLSLNEWEPVRTFIYQFTDTLTLVTRLASHLRSVLLPLIEHYFQYMDTISRLRLFKEIAEDYDALGFNGELAHDREQLAVK